MNRLISAVGVRTGPVRHGRTFPTHTTAKGKNGFIGGATSQGESEILLFAATAAGARTEKSDIDDPGGSCKSEQADGVVLVQGPTAMSEPPEPCLGNPRLIERQICVAAGLAR